MSRIEVGDTILGYAGGFFGRDSHDTRHVEAVGSDWVIAREERGTVVLASGEDIHEQLWEHCERNRPRVKGEMRIKEAAVFYQGKTLSGPRHGELTFQIIGEDGGLVKLAHVMMGFVTECGKFVSRQEATKIAFAAGQIKSDLGGRPLYSEDLLSHERSER